MTVLARNRLGEVFKDPAIAPVFYRMFAGMFVLVVVLSMNGGAVSLASVRGVIATAVLLFIVWQFPLGWGRILHRDGLLTWPVLSAILAWIGVALVYAIRTLG